MKQILALLFLSSICVVSLAQNKWMELPNTGFVKGARLSDTLYRIEDIYFADTNTGYAVTMPNRILKTVDGGISWKTKNDTTDTLTYPLFRSIEFSDDGKYGIAGSLGQYAKLLRSADAGETWTDVSAMVSEPHVSMKYNICGLAHHGDNFYGVGHWGSDTGRFYKSTDLGATWSCSLLDTGLIKNIVDVVFLSDDTGFISGRRGKESVVLKTTDGGIGWTKVFSDTLIGGRIWKLQFLTKEICYGSIEPLFFPDSVNMIQSYDGGNNWSIVHIGSKKKTTWVGTQGVGFVTPAKGWVGGYYDGVFETTDSGKTWTHLNFGYDFNRIFVIDSNHVFAGGHMPYKYGSDIYTRIKISQGSSNVIHSINVYPNPAKDLVQIKIDLQMGTNVLLEVYNADSKQIYRIANTYLEKGMHGFTWDCSNMPAGNYIVWFDNNEIPQAIKLVITK